MHSLKELTVWKGTDPEVLLLAEQCSHSFPGLAQLNLNVSTYNSFPFHGDGCHFPVWEDVWEDQRKEASRLYPSLNVAVHVHTPATLSGSTVVYQVTSELDESCGHCSRYLGARLAEWQMMR